MENLVIMEGRQALTTSLKVAEVFEKEHRNVLRDVHELLKELEDVENRGELKIELSSYRTVQGKELPMYVLNKNAFTILVMSYSGKKATQFKLAYINAFEAMEAHIREMQRTQLTNKEFALIHQLLNFFRYLDNSKMITELHKDKFIKSFPAYAGYEYADLVKLFHKMRNQLLGIGNFKQVQEQYKQFCLVHPQHRYIHNADKFLMMFTMDKFEYIRHAIADFLKLQLCSDSYTLKIAGEAKDIATQANLTLERTNEADLFREKEDNIINLGGLKQLAEALISVE